MAGDNVSAQRNISVSKKLLRLLQEHPGRRVQAEPGGFSSPPFLVKTLTGLL